MEQLPCPTAEVALCRRCRSESPIYEANAGVDTKRPHTRLIRPPRARTTKSSGTHHASQQHSHILDLRAVWPSSSRPTPGSSIRRGRDYTGGANHTRRVLRTGHQDNDKQYWMLEQSALKWRSEAVGCAEDRARPVLMSLLRDGGLGRVVWQSFVPAMRELCLGRWKMNQCLVW